MSSQKFCPNCGAAIDQVARFCPECGASLPPSSPAQQPVGGTTPPTTSYQQPYYQSPYQQPYYPGGVDTRGLHPLLAIAIVLFPIIGLVTFFVYRSSNRPNASNQSCYAALIGIAISIFLNIFFVGTMMPY